MGQSMRRRSVLKWLGGGLAALGGFALGLLPEKARAVWTTILQVRSVEIRGFGFDPASGDILWAGGRREPWRLAIDGLVEAPLSLSYDEVRALPQTELTADFHCVEGWSVKDVAWRGVTVPELLSRVRIRPGARFAVFHGLADTTYKPGGLDHYVESLPLADLLRPELKYFLALDFEGRPLNYDRGHPARIITPYDYGYKGVKYLTRIELTEAPVEGWWTRANPVYPIDAPVPEERLGRKDPRKG